MIRSLSCLITCTLLLWQPAFPQDNQLLVVASASIFADMAENIAGGHVKVQTIVPIGGDPHLYEPTPADVRLIAAADLVLKNGLTFEGWIDGLIKNAKPNVKVVTITEGIEAIQSDYKNAADPHAWMSAANGIVYIENIKNALVEADPLNREVYEMNYKVYRQQLEDLDAYIFKEIQKIPAQKRVLITSHDAFQYYGRRYGLQLESVLGISTEAEAQTADIIRLNDIIRRQNIPAVFIETTVNPKLLAQIAKDNKSRIGGSLYSDSIGTPDSPAPSYLAMLKYNTDTIVAALTQENTQETLNVHGEKTFPAWLKWSLLGLILVGSFLFFLKKLS